MIDSEKNESTENFIWIAFYNGYFEDVYDIYNALHNPDEKTGCAMRPKSWTEKENYGIDDFCGIFWCWLVMVYGDYGTSPRFGWIDKENVPI